MEFESPGLSWAGHPRWLFDSVFATSVGMTGIVGLGRASLPPHVFSTWLSWASPCMVVSGQLDFWTSQLVTFFLQHIVQETQTADCYNPALKIMQHHLSTCSWSKVSLRTSPDSKVGTHKGMYIFRRHSLLWWEKR